MLWQAAMALAGSADITRRKDMMGLKRNLTGMGAALSLLAIPVPAMASPAGDAKNACSSNVRRDYNAGTNSVTVSERGYDRFVVSGVAERRGEYRSFNCRTESGRVQSLYVAGMSRETGSSGNDTGKAVAAVGVAVALAAIIAAASSKKKSHEYDRYDDYRDDNYYRPANTGDSYRPASGVICYRRQRACYNAYNERYLASWTQHEFRY
jgi:hypothetical protein